MKINKKAINNTRFKKKLKCINLFLLCSGHLKTEGFKKVMTCMIFNLIFFLHIIKHVLEIKMATCYVQ